VPARTVFCAAFPVLLAAVVVFARRVAGRRAAVAERFPAVFAAFRPARARVLALRFALAMTLLVGPPAEKESAAAPVRSPFDRCR
jgi:hypothetical protein